MDENKTGLPAEENIAAEETAAENAAEKAENAVEKEEPEELTEAQKATKKVKKREKGVKSYQYFILRVIAFLIILWVLFFVFLGATSMPGEGMNPNVKSGDMVLFYRLDKTPKAQDVIVFTKKDDNGKKQTIVGRVIAVEGDEVDITAEGVLKVNGHAVSETNIYDKTTMPYVGEGAPTYPLRLEKDQCFVLGDNRSEARDSRVFGAVNKSEILGTVITILRRQNI